MVDKEKLLIYPFDTYCTPLLRHREFLKNYDIVRVVSPNGWGFSGKDASSADGGPTIGFKVSGDFEGVLDSCDAVMFTESNNGLNFKKLIYPKILRAIQARKNIVCTISLEPNTENEIARICETNGVEFRYCKLDKKLEHFEVGRRSILEISTPVIFVMGISERTHKFEIQLNLRERLLEKGYSVSQIGSRNGCELFGFHSFPSFMYSSFISESDKVILLNNYIKDIEIKEEPDVIIIAIPGGIVPFNNQFNNRFGILAYEVSQAITPDAVIFSALYEDYNHAYFEKLSNLIRYRLGFDVDCYNLSNVKFDWEAAKFQDLMVFSTFDSSFIDEKKKAFNMLKTPVYNVLNEKDSNDMPCYLLRKLETYGKVESI